MAYSCHCVPAIEGSDGWARHVTTNEAELQTPWPCAMGVCCMRNLLMAWVVDTARQKYVATATHEAAEKRDTSMPKAKILHDKRNGAKAAKAA